MCQNGIFFERADGNALTLKNIRGQENYKEERKGIVV